MKTLKLATLSTFIAAVAATGVHAQDHAAEVTIFGGYHYFDEAIDDDKTWGAAIGIPVSDRWTLEAVWSAYDTTLANSAADLDGTQYRLDALYNIATTSSWKPFVAVGLGDLKREFNTGVEQSHRETLLNLGAGLKKDLGNNFQFRTEARAFNSLDNEYTDFALNAGITYLIGKKATKPAPVAPAPVVEADSDNDGVVDSKDQCANTPSTHKVDSVGCSLKLTETVAVKLNITFDTAKAVIKTEYQSEVQQLASFMNQYADTVVTIEGHTDSQGADAYNQKLSQQRADAVKAALINNHGVEARRVNAVGYGESKPVASNATAEGREQNRRVVAQVSTQVTKTETK
jgi:OOP family OmpA-OmpF porin